VEEEVAKNRQKDYMLIQQAARRQWGDDRQHCPSMAAATDTVSLLIQNLTESYVYGGFNKEFMEETIEHAMQVIQYMSKPLMTFAIFSN